MGRSWLSVLATVVIAGAAGFFLAGPRAFPPESVVLADTLPVSEAQRAAGPQFAPELSPGDQTWILEAIASARPEAQALIAEIDGMVTFGVTPGPEMGVARLSAQGARVELNLAELNGRRVMDRDTTVLHELGHVIDFVLVEQAVNDGLEAGIPRSGPCDQGVTGLVGSCTAPEERFADTFAKWALRGAVSGVGAGYGIAAPPSLEDWGAPLTALANSLARAQ